MTKLIDINSQEFADACLTIKRGATVQGAHPFIKTQVYELAGGSYMIDDPMHGAMIFPPEHDTVRFAKNMIVHLDGSKPKIK